MFYTCLVWLFLILDISPLWGSVKLKNGEVNILRTMLLSFIRLTKEGVKNKIPYTSHHGLKLLLWHSVRWFGLVVLLMKVTCKWVCVTISHEAFAISCSKNTSHWLPTSWQQWADLRQCVFWLLKMNVGINFQNKFLGFLKCPPEHWFNLCLKT